MTEDKRNDTSLDDYVAEKTIQIEETNLKSIGKSIENERARAGILVGFFFLILIQLYPLFKELNLYLKGIVTVLIFIVTYLLINCFCSEKINEGVQVDNNFDYAWETKKHFLKLYYSVINKNKEKQKKLLSRLSKNVRLSIILLSLIILTILTHNSLKFMYEEEKNPMEPDKQELNERIRSQDDDNPMESGYTEKSE